MSNLLGQLLSILWIGTPVGVLELPELVSDLVNSFARSGNLSTGNWQRPRIFSGCIVSVPLCADMMDFAKQSPLDQVDCVIVENTVVSLVAHRKQRVGFVRCSRHQFALGDVVSHQFFAQHVLAGLHRRDRNRSMQEQRRGNDDTVNVGILDGFLPILINRNFLSGFGFGLPTVN